MPLPATPAKILASTPVVTNREQLDLALREVAYIEALEQTVQAECDAECDKIRAKHQQRLRVQVGSSLVSTADRYELLSRAIATYCDEHRSELIAKPKAKFAKMTWGKVLWRSKGGGIFPINDELDLVDRIDKQHDLRATIVKLLKSLKIGDRRVDQFIDVSMKPAIARIKQQVERAELTLDDLKLVGLELREPKDQFEFESVSYQSVETETGKRSA